MCSGDEGMMHSSTKPESDYQEKIATLRFFEGMMYSSTRPESDYQNEIATLRERETCAAEGAGKLATRALQAEQKVKALEAEKAKLTADVQRLTGPAADYGAARHEADRLTARVTELEGEIHDIESGEADEALADAERTADGLRQQVTVLEARAFHISTQLTEAMKERDEARRERDDARLGTERTSIACAAQIRAAGGGAAENLRVENAYLTKAMIELGTDRFSLQCEVDNLKKQLENATRPIHFDAVKFMRIP